MHEQHERGPSQTYLVRKKGAKELIELPGARALEALLASGTLSPADEVRLPLGTWLRVAELQDFVNARPLSTVAPLPPPGPRPTPTGPVTLPTAEMLTGPASAAAPRSRRRGAKETRQSLVAPRTLWLAAAAALLVAGSFWVGTLDRPQDPFPPATATALPQDRAPIAAVAPREAPDETQPAPVLPVAAAVAPTPAPAEVPSAEPEPSPAERATASSAPAKAKTKAASATPAPAKAASKARTKSEPQKEVATPDALDLDAIAYDELVKRAHKSSARRALVLFGKAAQRWPGRAEVHGYLGRAYLRAGQAGPARESYQACLRKLDGFAPCVYGLARAYERLGARAKAIPLYERYLELHPGGSDARRAATRLEALESESAERHPEGALVEDPAE